MPPGLDTPEDRYDVGVRSFCREKGIVWQPWGVLWGSPDLLCSRLVETVAGALGVEREIAMYACVQRLEENVSILVGTGREGRMTAAVDGMRKVDEWRRKDSNGEKWDVWMGEFRELLLEEEVER
jgi:hypothetical protein